jgi:hypothetical protein
MKHFGAINTLTLGIKAAKTDYYLLTPIAIKFKDWITAMSSQFTMQKNDSIRVWRI